MTATHDLKPLSAATNAYLRSSLRLMIDGAFQPAVDGASVSVRNPATGEIVAEAACGGAADIDLAVAAARRAFRGEWSRTTAAERERLLHRLANLIERDRDLLAELEVVDNGMPLSMAQFTIDFSLNFLRYYAGWPTKIEGATIPASPQGKRPGEFLTYTLREPVGVVGAIIPWNSPLIMAVLKLAPALATGCTLVLKPAELTPLTAIKLAELCIEAGLPSGVVNVVPGFGETAGARLAAHPDVDKVTFTGSTEVGRHIVRASTGNLKKVTLELGGKSPVVVFPDADLEAVIPGAALAAFFLQGQNCMAGTRLFVHHQVHDAVVEGIAAFARQLPVGNGFAPHTVLGPLISAEHRERVLGFIEAGRRDGARLVCGGEPLPGPGYFLPPTVFTGCTPSMSIVRDEIFGPVLAVQAFGDDDLESIANQANETVYGLSGSVWTRDIGIAHRMVRLIDAGQVSINCHAAVDPAIPFGGNRQSGWGREFGAEGLDAYLKTKAITATW